MHRLLLCLTVVVLLLILYHFGVSEKFSSNCCQYKFGARYFGLTGAPPLLSYGIFPNITN